MDLKEYINLRALFSCCDFLHGADQRRCHCNALADTEARERGALDTTSGPISDLERLGCPISAPRSMHLCILRMLHLRGTYMGFVAQLVLFAARHCAKLLNLLEVLRTLNHFGAAPDV